MFDPLVDDLSQRYGLGDRGRDLFGLLMAYVHNDRRGGFNGFVEGFREQGHGELVSSWLGNADAGGLTASDVGMVFGQGLLNDWGSRLGASRATVAAAIAGVLPRLVAELTPGGRIPGGFAPLAPSLMGQSRTPNAAPPALRESDRAPVRDADLDADRDALRVRPGVDGLLGAEPGPAGDPRWVPQPAQPVVDAPRVEAQRVDDARRDDARLAPDTHDDRPTGERSGADRFDDGRRPPAAVQPLRREPVFGEDSPAVRTPMQARRDAAPPLDPAEQRAAEMAAVFDRGPRPGAPAGAPGTDARPDSWRPAVHPPRPKRRGLGAFGWLVLLLAIAGVVGWYAWSQGLLAPYILQSGLPILPAPPA